MSGLDASGRVSCRFVAGCLCAARGGSSPTAAPDGAYRPFAMRIDAREGTAPERLGPAHTQASDPVVWPGGKSVLVSEAGGWAIRFRAVAGGEASIDESGPDELILTPSPAQDAEPSLAPDGTRLVFTRTIRDDADLWVLDLATGKAAPAVVDSLQNEDNGAFSPDGSTMTCQEGNARNLVRWYLGTGPTGR